MISDWDCLERARRGDETGWQRLIEQYTPQLIKTALLITGSMVTAQDLVQEAFVRLLRHGSRHREGSLGAYLSTIAYRLALKEKERAQRDRSVDGVILTNPAPSPLEAVLKSERDHLLARAIRSLEEHHRDTLVLRFYGGHSYDEIARIMSLPIGTVKSRIFYAVKECRRLLREKGILE
jgi:RNA polymerase sigma-70 factor (ECF subfamily)